MPTHKTIEAAALADEKVQSRTAGKTVVKVIVVPRKLVNLVVKERWPRLCAVVFQSLVGQYGLGFSNGRS